MYAANDTCGIYNYVESGAAIPKLMSAETLIGNDVVNEADERLGDIKEIILDAHSGQIAYAVLSLNGFAGMGDRLFAVPWQALTLATSNKKFVLNVPKERLKLTLGFDKFDWPDMADQFWQEQAELFYGRGAAGESRPVKVKDIQ